MSKWNVLTLRLVHHSCDDVNQTRTKSYHISTHWQIKEKKIYLFYCHNGIAQLDIAIKRNTKKMVRMNKKNVRWSNKCKTGADQNIWYECHTQCKKHSQWKKIYSRIVIPEFSAVLIVQQFGFDVILQHHSHIFAHKLQQFLFSFGESIFDVFFSWR